MSGPESPTTAREQCDGPLVWFDAPGGAVLECASCPYVVVTGSVNDPAHAYTPVIREGLATR